MSLRPGVKASSVSEPCRITDTSASPSASVLDTPGFRSAVLADPQGAVFSIGQLTAGP
jgi:hypothetical protein